MRISRNFKGQGADMVLFIGVAFTMAIVGLICFYLWTQFASAAPQIFGNTAPQPAITAHAQSALQLFNNIVVAIIFAIAFGSIISAIFVQSHPVFFVISIFTLIMEIILAVIFHNAYFTIIQNSAFGGVFLQFTTLNLFFQYLPEICFVIAVIVMIVTYGKGGGGGNAEAVGGGYY